MFFYLRLKNEFTLHKKIIEVKIFMSRKCKDSHQKTEKPFFSQIISSQSLLSVFLFEIEKQAHSTQKNN